jgi:hypothetical protein
MTGLAVYRDAGHAIGRIMSIEANDGTAKAQWQRRYQPAGYAEQRGVSETESLSAEERLAQDSLARRIVHRVLPPLQWHALVAKYSINDLEVAESVRWLIPRVQSPAHRLFVTKCVTCWAVPLKPGAVGVKTSRRGLGVAFYSVATWDATGAPDRTLRRWRQKTERWLQDQVGAAHVSVEVVLQEAGLIATVSA